MKRYFRLILNPHGIAGFIAPFFCFIGWWLVGLNTFLFLVYELAEWYQIRDSAYKNLAEFSTGFFTGSIVLLVLKFLC